MENVPLNEVQVLALSAGILLVWALLWLGHGRRPKGFDYFISIVLGSWIGGAAMLLYREEFLMHEPQWQRGEFLVVGVSLLALTYMLVFAVRGILIRHNR